MRRGVEGVGRSLRRCSSQAAQANPASLRLQVKFGLSRSGEEEKKPRWKEVSKFRCVSEYALEPEDLDQLQPLRRRRSAYHGDPPNILYAEEEVKALALQKHGSQRALEKAQARMKAAGAEAKDPLFFRSATSPESSSPSPSPSPAADSSKVVLTALAANGIDAGCKLLGWWLTGSHSLFAEFIHSCADTGNQAVVYWGIRNSAQRPDRLHPYGYANVRHVSSLISGVGIFFVGTGLNVYHGIHALYVGAALEPLSWGVGLLGISFLTQGTTIYRAMALLSQRATAAGCSRMEYIRRNEDPSLNVVLMEDSASIVGVGVAGLSIAASHWLASGIPDALGSIAIGALLGAVARQIVRANASHLVGRSIPDGEQRTMVAELEKDPIVNSVHDVKATEMGGDQIRFKAELDFDGRAITRAYLADVDQDALLAELRSVQNKAQLREFLEKHGEGVIDKLGAEIDRIEQNLKKNHPDVRHVDLEAL